MKAGDDNRTGYGINDRSATNVYGRSSDEPRSITAMVPAATAATATGPATTTMTAGSLTGRRRNRSWFGDEQCGERRRRTIF